MRDSISGTWIIGLVMMFILIFAAYLAVSINYQRAFLTKNAIVSIIEMNEGHGHSRTQEQIEGYLSTQGVQVRANCGNRGRGFPNDGAAGSIYCVDGPFRHAHTSTDRIPVGYYRVTVFFRFDLPIIGHILTFPVHGRTRPISHVCPQGTPNCFVD